jgi:TonB family protein
LVAVAEPNPAIAFAVPVEGPVGIVPAKEATSPRPVVKAVEAAPSVQPLTYGSGDGRQPSPTYPFAAQRQGQEGRVIVQFDVGEDGRVLDAAAIRPSPWPLLNAEAVRVIRERWRFRAGPLRRYEVSINFELRK